MPSVLKNPPIFLRFPDSHVLEHVEPVQQALYDLFNEMTPQVVIGFGPDGITDHWDLPRGSAYVKALVHTMPTEKFIIARNRSAGEWLKRCFEDEQDKSDSDKAED